MAILENAFGSKCVVQTTEYALDRVDLEYQNNSSSNVLSQHVISLRWRDNIWAINNSSQYPIWVSGEALLSGEERSIETRCEIQLTKKWYKKWSIIDLSPPYENDVFLSKSGDWYCHALLKKVWLSDGDIIVGDKQKWCLCSIKDGYIEHISEPPPITNYDKATMLFEVSLDEEHVFASIETEQQVFKLHERVHHYLLVTLARLKLQDHRDGYDSSSCGWVDMEELCKMLGLDASHINIQIYRARRQINESLNKEEELPALIERRSGCLRFGAWSFCIIRGDELEGNMSLI